MLGFLVGVAIIIPWMGFFVAQNIMDLMHAHRIERMRRLFEQLGFEVILTTDSRSATQERDTNHG